MSITQDRLKQLLDYEPETGVFRVKVSRRGLKASVGDLVGTYVPKDNAMVVQLDGKAYGLHNLAWLWVYGVLPPKQLLRLDCDGRNNAIANFAIQQTGRRGELTHERLCSLLDYSAASGLFVWKIRPAKNVPAGGIAGGVQPNGYRIIRIDGVDYTAQRLVWFYIHGEMPDRVIMFRDGDRANCKVENLKLPSWDHSTPEGQREYQRAHRQSSFAVHKASDLRKDFGMSMDVYQHLFVKQGGVCAVCKQPETEKRNGQIKWLAVDHCHDTHIVRGLLCVACNISIGRMGDDPERFEAAAAYIRKSRELPAEDDNVIRLIPRKAS